MYGHDFDSDNIILFKIVFIRTIKYFYIFLFICREFSLLPVIILFDRITSYSENFDKKTILIWPAQTSLFGFSET